MQRHGGKHRWCRGSVLADVCSLFISLEWRGAEMEALAGVGAITPWLFGARNLRSSVHLSSEFMSRQFIIGRTSSFLRFGLFASSKVHGSCQGVVMANEVLASRSLGVYPWFTQRFLPHPFASTNFLSPRGFCLESSSAGGSKRPARGPIMAAKKAAEVAREREPICRDNEKNSRELLAKFNIVLPSYGPGQYRIVCPECDGGSSREKSLSVGIDEKGVALWICHRGTCGWKGSGPTKVVGTKDEARPNSTAKPAKVLKERKQTVKPQPITIESLALKPPPVEVVEWFHERGISANTLEQNQVRIINTTGDVVIAFPYTRDGEIVNCKFRSVDKKFWQVKGAEKILYGLDDVINSKEIIIVEGEIDKLTLYESGYTNCVSVPDGAPPKVSADGLVSTQDKKFEYLYNCREYFKNATRIVLATDSDEPGQALAEELARRLGRERCWRVRWPRREGEDAVCKDANEVLQYLGPEAVRNVIETSELYPIRGLFQFSQFFKEIDDYYHLRMGDERGVSTGWVGLDSIYRVVPGELTVVTGVPNSGKSEWIDALLCNLSRDHNWTFALCSMENKVREHARKLLEKHLKKPFFDAPYAQSIARMDRGSLERGKVWLNQNFFLIRCEDDELPSVDWVLDLAKAAVLRHGVRGLVIDPYNELDHQRPSSQTETEYVSQMLTRVKRFAQHHDCHVWFVAHPKQLQVWRGEAPGLYDISGSAHFINKCDNGLVIHRNRDPDAGPLDQVQVLVRKVRNKAAGTIGEATLRYDRATGEYADAV